MLLILLSVACTGPDGADDTGSGSDLVGDAANGATVYTATCAGCHGEDGMAGTDIGGTAAADLTVRVPLLSDADLADQIENGGGAMPAQTVDAQGVADVIAHLRVTFP